MAAATPACFHRPHAPAANTSARQCRPSQFTCKALKEAYDTSTTSHVDLSRRFALSSLVGAALFTSKVSPADAVYGESANVFGKQKKTDFVEIKGDGFKIMIPAKWNPSKEREFSGQVVRYEDGFDTISNISVIIVPSAKSSIADYGTPEDFLKQFDYLLGKQTFSGKTDSEGGFDSSAVATANILETSTTEVDGKKYYSISVLTRTADGDEGGKHQLITAAVNNGKVYICKAQAGDKRWFKGARRSVENASTSFNVV